MAGGRQLRTLGDVLAEVATLSIEDKAKYSRMVKNQERKSGDELRAAYELPSRRLWNENLTVKAIDDLIANLWLQSDEHKILDGDALSRAVQAKWHPIKIGLMDMMAVFDARAVTREMEDVFVSVFWEFLERHLSGGELQLAEFQAAIESTIAKHRAYVQASDMAENVADQVASQGVKHGFNFLVTKLATAVGVSLAGPAALATTGVAALVTTAVVPAVKEFTLRSATAISGAAAGAAVHAGQVVTSQTDCAKLLQSVKTVLLDLSSVDSIQRQKRQTKLKFTAQLKHNVEESICKPLDQKHDNQSSQESAEVRQKLRAYTRRLAVPRDDAGLSACEAALETALRAVPISLFGQFLLLWGDTSATARGKVDAIKAQLALAERAAQEIIEVERLLQSVPADVGNPFVSCCQKIFTIPELPAEPTDGPTSDTDSRVAFYRARIEAMPGNPLFRHAVALAWQQETGLSIAGVESYAHWANALVCNDLLMRHQVDDMRRCWEMTLAERQAYLCVRLATAVERSEHAELIQRARSVLEAKPSLESVQGTASALHGEDVLWKSSGARTPAMRLLWLEHLDLLDQLVAYSKSSQPPVDVRDLITEPYRKLETLLNAPAFDEPALGALQSALITMHHQYRQLPMDKRPLLKPASPLSHFSLLADVVNFVQVLSVADDAQAELADHGEFDITVLDLARTDSNSASHADVVKQIQLLREILSNRNRVLMAQAEYHFFMSMAIAAQARGRDAYEVGLAHLAAYVSSTVPGWYKPVKPFDTSNFFNDPKAVERLQGLIKPSIARVGSLWQIQCQPYAGFSAITVKELFADVLCPDELLDDSIVRRLSHDELSLLTKPSQLWLLYRQVLAISTRPDVTYTSAASVLKIDGSFNDVNFLQAVAQLEACKMALAQTELPDAVRASVNQKILIGTEKLKAQRDAFETVAYSDLLALSNEHNVDLTGSALFQYFQKHRIVLLDAKSLEIPMLKELPWLSEKFNHLMGDVVLWVNNYYEGNLTTRFWEQLQKAGMDFSEVKAIFSRNIDAMAKKFSATPDKWLAHALEVEKLFNPGTTMDESQLVIIAKIGLLPMMHVSDEQLWSKTSTGETAWIPRLAKREYFKKIYDALCRALTSYQESYWKSRTTPGMEWNQYRKTAIPAETFALREKLKVRFRDLVGLEDKFHIYQPIGFEQFLTKFPNKGKLEAFLKTLCARRDGDRDQTDPTSAVAFVQQELRTVGVVWQAEEQHWFGPVTPAKVGFNNTVAQQWCDPDKQWVIPIVLRHAPDFNAETACSVQITTLNENDWQKSQFTSGFVESAFTAMAGEAIRSVIAKDGGKRGEYLRLCQHFDTYLQIKLSLQQDQTLDAWVEEMLLAYRRRAEKECSTLVASLNSIPIELVFKEEVTSLRVANAGLAAGIMHPVPQQGGVKRLEKIRLRSGAIDQWLDSAWDATETNAPTVTVRQVMARVCLSALDPPPVSAPVAAGALSSGGAPVSTTSASLLLLTENMDAADERNQELADGPIMLTSVAGGPAIPSVGHSSVSGKAFYFDLPYKDSNGDEIKADAQADAIITAARQLQTTNPRGVMITYSANDKQSQLIWNSYQQGKSTATLEITGNGQATVMAALIGKLQPGQPGADLADFIKIAAVTTMGAGQANMVLAGHADLVARDLDNIRQWVQTHGYDLLLWQNQDTGSGDNAKVAIGGGNTKLPADIDHQIQTVLKSIVSVDSHVVSVVPKAVAGNGSHGGSKANSTANETTTTSPTPMTLGTKTSVEALEVAEADREIFADMLGEVQRIRWGALYKQFTSSSEAASTALPAAAVSLGSSTTELQGVLKHLYFKMVHEALSKHVDEYVKSRDYQRAFERFPAFVVKRDGAYELVNFKDFCVKCPTIQDLEKLIQGFCKPGSGVSESTIQALQAVLRTVGIQYKAGTDPLFGEKKGAQATCQLNAEPATALREELSRQAAVTVANANLEEKLEFKQEFVGAEKTDLFPLPAPASAGDTMNASLSTPAWVETVIVQAVGVQGRAQFQTSAQYQQVVTLLSKLNIKELPSAVLAASDNRIVKIRDELKLAGDNAARSALQERWLKQGLRINIKEAMEQRAVPGVNSISVGVRTVTTYSVAEVVDVATTVLKMPWSNLASAVPAAGTGVNATVSAGGTIKDGLCYHVAVAIAPPKPVAHQSVSTPLPVGPTEDAMLRAGGTDATPPADATAVAAANLDVDGLKSALSDAIAGYNNHPIRGSGKSLLALQTMQGEIGQQQDFNAVLSELIAGVVVSPSQHFDAPSARGRLLRQLSNQLGCPLLDSHSYSLESTATQLSQLVCKVLQGQYTTPEVGGIDDKLRNFLTANFKRALEHPADFGHQGVVKMVQAMLKIKPGQQFMREFGVEVAKRNNSNRTLLSTVLKESSPTIVDIFLANRNAFWKENVPKTARAFENALSASSAALGLSPV